METLIRFIESITLLAVVKGLMVVFLVIYSVFAYLMMRQTKIMTKAVSMSEDYVIRVMAIAHFVAALAVLLAAIVIL